MARRRRRMTIQQAGRRGGRRIQWEVEDAATHVSGTHTVLVPGTAWENTAGQGVERGCTFMGLHLFWQWNDVDLILPSSLNFSIFKTDETAPLGTTEVNVFLNDDVLHSGGLTALGDAYVVGTLTDNSWSCFGHLFVKSKRKLTSEDAIRFACDHNGALLLRWRALLYAP